MKATELRKGDWCTSPDLCGKPAYWTGDIEHYKKELAGSDYSRLLFMFNYEKHTSPTQCDGAWVPESRIEPIPLNTDIFEKNGFEWRAYGVVLPGEDIAFFQCGDRWKVKPCQMSDETICYIQYVHELQHILQDNDIDDKITL